MTQPPHVARPVARTLQRSFTDPAEIGQFFGDGVEYLPAKHSCYRLDAEFVCVPGLSVEWLSHRGEVIVEENRPDRQFFAVFGNGSGDLHLDGDTANSNRIAAATTDQHVARLRGDNSYALLNVEGVWLDTRGKSLLHLDPSPRESERLTSLIAQVRQLSQLGRGKTDCLAAACESVADALHAIVEHVDLGPPATPDLACQIVADAITAIREERASSITELTKSVAASRSSLYRSFDSVLGISPYAYMQRRRLIRLRRRLLEAENEPGMVTREAANVGAFHLGNLAKSYRAMFGELPHDTARRSISTVPGNDPAITVDLT